MIGMSPSEWERLTPSEFGACVSAWMEKRRDDQQIAQRNIYNLSLLIRAMVWNKRAPDYEDAYGGEMTEIMTDEQMYAQVKALNALLGGEEVD